MEIEEVYPADKSLRELLEEGWVYTIFPRCSPDSELGRRIAEAIAEEDEDGV